MRRRRRKNNQNERELFFWSPTACKFSCVALTQTHRQFSYMYTSCVWKWHIDLVRVCVCGVCVCICVVYRLLWSSGETSESVCKQLRQLLSAQIFVFILRKMKLVTFLTPAEFHRGKGKQRGCCSRSSKDRNSIAFHICIVITAELHCRIFIRSRRELTNRCLCLFHSKLKDLQPLSVIQRYIYKFSLLPRNVAKNTKKALYKTCTSLSRVLPARIKRKTYINQIYKYI